MGGSRLTPAQVEILHALAGMTPAWRLAGGAALAGFHTRHRGTRDLDLFWAGKDLAQLDADVLRRVAAAGFIGQILQRDPAFCRLRVARGPDVVVVDLVADPVPTVAAPAEHALGDARILEDAPRKEAGFSPVTLAWVLEQLPVAAMGRALGRVDGEIRELEAFRQGLAGRILAAAKPG